MYWHRVTVSLKLSFWYDLHWLSFNAHDYNYRATYQNEQNDTAFEEKERLIEELRILKEELKEKNIEIERLKNAPRISDFTSRLTLKDETKPNGKVFCDRRDFCQNIQKRAYTICETYHKIDTFGLIDK